MRTKQKVFVGILLASLILPGVLAQVETAPSLVWTRTFTGTHPSQVTQSGGNWHQDASTQRSCDVQDRKLDVEWLSGAIWVVYTDGNNAETGGQRNTGTYHKLNPSTGGTAISGSFSLSGFNQATCGIAVDQRGRVYIANAPCEGTSFFVGSQALETATGDLLKEFTASEACLGENNFAGPVVDVLTDVSVNGTRFGWNAGASIRYWTSSSTVADGFTQGCNQGRTSAQGIFSYREDETAVDRIWTLDNLGNLRARTISDCSSPSSDTPGFQAARSTCRTASAEIVCADTNGVSFDLELERADPTDVTGTISFTTDTMDPPDPYFAGTSRAQGDPHALNLDVDGDWVLCGILSDGAGANGRSYIAKYNGAFTTLLWNVTVDSNDFFSGDCGLGPAGEIYWYGTIPTPERIQVRKYCCNDADVKGSELIIAQIETPTGGGGGGGGSNVVTVARDFCTTAWGFDCGWLIMIGAVGLVTFGFARLGGSGLVVGIGVLLGVGLGVFLLQDFEWLLFLAAFIVIAFAGHRMFGGNGGDGTE
jgi:hypothetical protein